MPLLTIHHTTLYRYQQPVSLGEHRIMMRPREAFDQRLLSARLIIDPEPSELRWLHDVFGNSVAVASFERRTARLTITSETTLEHAPLAQTQVDVEDYARLFPFTYSAEDMPDLLRSIERQHLDPGRIVDNWARAFLNNDASTGTISLLTEMATSIKRDFTYVPRHKKGTQSPLETLKKRQGTCRDFAVLMIEAVRALGFAARFVSGYVYNPSRSEGVVGGGNTHAWVRIFLPGSGWVEFDPTNGIIGNRGLIRVAVARDPYQALPLSGTWFGLPASFLGMDVTVDVHRADPDQFPSTGHGAVNSRRSGASGK
ncbi:transglutaminase family protein [Novosphingobium sp. AP12]|uniref:transglutaminase family protein n=1 Tax=Novosphingobium sp. AP12 TaxID=1144305 RepID=UPI000272150B|nr:transglutaminase family protein [Novosphingobium sp. AP12]EJL24952.1 transglutaminase-like enzyme, predicted cysteine protease [Novosphingobium sp. AP12]